MINQYCVNKMLFVVAFVFRTMPGARAPDVFLVKKNPRRENMMWQRGLWNGIGGGVNPGESPYDASKREWREETTVEPNYFHGWRCFAVETGRDYQLYCFRGDAAENFLSTTNWPEYNDADEMMSWLSMADMDKYQVLGNLRWMLPLALDPRGSVEPVHFQPVSDISRQPTWGYYNERR